MDRITNLLMSAQSRQQQPQIEDIGRAFAMADFSSPATGYDAQMLALQNLRQEQAQSEISGVAETLKSYAAQGEKNAKAIDEAITRIAGDDPNTYAQIAQGLHDLPDEINATNANMAVMRIAAQQGLKPKYEPQSSEAKLALDYQRGLVPEDLYRASMQKSSSGGATMPADVQTFQYFQSLSPEQQDQFKALKGGPRDSMMTRAEAIMADNPELSLTDALNIARGLPQGSTIKDGQVQYLPGAEAVMAQGAEAKEEGKTKGKSDAEFLASYPSTAAAAQYTYQLIDDLINHPGISRSVGATSVLPNIPGGAAQDFQNRLDQIGGRQFLEAFESLKGGGQITQIEGEKATNAIARMQTSGSEKEFIAAAREFQKIIKDAIERSNNRAEQLTGKAASPTNQQTTRKKITLDELESMQ